MNVMADTIESALETAPTVGPDWPVRLPRHAGAEGR